MEKFTCPSCFVEIDKVMFVEYFDVNVAEIKLDGDRLEDGDDSCFTQWTYICPNCKKPIYKAILDSLTPKYRDVTKLGHKIVYRSGKNVIALHTFSDGRIEWEVGHLYDESVGEWAWGSYYSDLDQALQRLADITAEDEMYVERSCQR